MCKATQIRLKIEEFISWTLLAFLILFVFSAAVLRWFGVSIVWSVDIAQFIFTWLCFIAADLAYANGKHMGVDIIRNKLHGKGRLIYDIVLEIIIIVFLISVFYFGIKLSISNSVRRFNSLNVSYSWTTVAASVGSFLMMLTAVEKVIGNGKKLRARGAEASETEEGKKA
mgnify:CR=1 FL=1